MTSSGETGEAPPWAALLGEEYGAFRAVLVDVLDRMGIAVDEDHIDCGILHTPSGSSMGLSNLVRLCHPAPRDRWPAMIAEHLRRSTAKPVPMAFELAGPRLRLRLVPERHVQKKPEVYVSREIARELHVAIAVDNPEHVVFVNQREPGEWGQTVDELFAIAERNTRDEPALDQELIEIPDGPTIIALVGESYFAASQVLFLERTLDPGAFGHVVAMPDRHALLALPLVDSGALAGLGVMVQIARSRFTEAPGAITDQLFWRRPDGGLVVIACGVREDGDAWVAPTDEFNELVARLPKG